MFQEAVMERARLDNRLLRAMHEGAAALPGDLRQLKHYCDFIGTMLAEKAAELEPTWALALAAAAEVETLQILEIAVAEKAAAVEADSIAAVLTKLAIWEALSSGEETAEASLRDRLVASVRSDLERLAPKGAPDPGTSAVV